jgi:hypothetical protein
MVITSFPGLKYIFSVSQCLCGYILLATETQRHREKNSPEPGEIAQVIREIFAAVFPKAKTKTRAGTGTGKVRTAINSI